MVSHELDPVEAATRRVLGVLGRARSFKPDGAIEPPLPVAEFATSDDLQWMHELSQLSTMKLVLERVARNIFYDVVACTSITDPSFVQIWNLFDVLQYFEEKIPNYTSPAIWMIEELLDSQNIDGCRLVFDYLESRREGLISKDFKNNKDLVILRSCNELLRRMSRAEDAVFCGRVFIFMFLSFPLGDRSSVNLRGEFHVENVTTFEETLRPSGEADEKMIDTIDGVEEKAGDERKGTQLADIAKETKPLADGEGLKGKVKVDSGQLYPIFWSLQQGFSNPSRLFVEEYFEGFKRGLEMTLAKFREVPKVIQSKSGGGPKRDEKRFFEDSMDEGDNEDAEDVATVGVDEFASTFNPKYLTSKDLFELELSDLAFQRHILVQALILIDFLLSLTEKAKARLSQHNPQKALVYNFTLSEKDAEWALALKSRIATYLQEGPDGKFYYRMVDTVLSRDKNWVRWKSENCPEINRAPQSAIQHADALKGATRTCAPKRLRAMPMGGLDLAFLAEGGGAALSGQHQQQQSQYSQTQPQTQSQLSMSSGSMVNNGSITATQQIGLESLKEQRNSDRFLIPSTESYVRAISGDELDLEMADTEEEKATLEEARASKTWRVLRLAARDKLSQFDRIDDGRALEALFAVPAPSNSTSANQPEEQEEHQQGQAEAAQAQPSSHQPMHEDDNDGGAFEKDANKLSEGTAMPESNALVDSEGMDTTMAAAPSAGNHDAATGPTKEGVQTTLPPLDNKGDEERQQRPPGENAAAIDNSAVHFEGAPESSGGDSGVDARMQVGGEEERAGTAGPVT